MNSLGRNNLIGYCLPATRKKDVRIGHLFPQSTVVVTSTEIGQKGNANIAIADSHGNSVSVNCHSLGEFAIAMDGKLANHDQVYRRILTNNMVLLNKSSEELVAYLLAEEALHGNSLPAAIKQFLGKYPGGYSLLVMNKERIYGARDCYGVKPLVIGLLDDNEDVIEYDVDQEQDLVINKVPNLIASTSIILENMGAKYIRQVQPGEIVELSASGVRSLDICFRKSGDASSFCALEYVMLESPFSFLQEQRVYDVRFRLGLSLALESVVDSDCLITLPSTSLAFALGYSKASGISIVEAFYYSTCASDSKQLSLYHENVMNKVVTLVIDSVLNQDLAAALFLLGESPVKQVHVRVASPAIVAPCPFSIDVTVNSASVRSVPNIKYLSLDSMSATIRKKIQDHEVKNIGHCFNCFGTDHPMMGLF